MNERYMKKIAWIGTGVMGNAMVQHLITAWHEVYVWNRTKEKTDNLVAMWAVYKNSISEVVQVADIIFTIIWDPQNVRESYFWEGGIIDSAHEWSVLVDMTTTEPSLAQEIYSVAQEKNIEVLDAPVSGWDVGAINGALSIMVGGKQEIFENVLPLFESMWKAIVYTGIAGMWQHTKMANQISIAGNTIGLCESLVYAEKMGLDIEKTIQVVSWGAAGSWGWTNLAPRIHVWELDTCFFIKHFVKDMRIVLKECEKMNITLPWLTLVHQLYTSLVSHGDENLWTQALILALRRMNNMDEK